MTVLTKIDTPLGVMIAASDKVALTGLWFEGQKYECAFVKNPKWDDSLALWEPVKTWINQYYHEKTQELLCFRLLMKEELLFNKVFGIHC